MGRKGSVECVILVVIGGKQTFFVVPHLLQRVHLFGLGCQPQTQGVVSVAVSFLSILGSVACCVCVCGILCVRVRVWYFVCVACCV